VEPHALTTKPLEPRPRLGLRDGWRYLRRRGPRATIRALAERYVFRSYAAVVVATDISGPPITERLGDIVFRLATPDDLASLGELDRRGRGAALQEEIADSGDWLFVACHGQRIVAIRRCSRAVPEHSLISRVVELKAGQVWGADIYCVPEYRNRGIGGHLALFGERYLASLGYRQLFGVIAVGNAASIRMHSRVGKKPVCRVSYLRLLFYERLHISRETSVP
jgi:GNAT superfamily N-acetyltransferase